MQTESVQYHLDDHLDNLNDQLNQIIKNMAFIIDEPPKNNPILQIVDTSLPPLTPLPQLSPLHQLPPLPPLTLPPLLVNINSKKEYVLKISSRKKLKKNK